MHGAAGRRQGQAVPLPEAKTGHNPRIHPAKTELDRDRSCDGKFDRDGGGRGAPDTRCRLPASTQGKASVIDHLRDHPERGFPGVSIIAHHVEFD